MPLAAAAVVLLIAWVALLNGATTATQWPEIATRPQPQAATDAPVIVPWSAPVLQQYVQVWSSPLFNTGRQPDATNAAPTPIVFVPPLDGVVLTGIVSAQQVKIAMLKDNSGEALAKREGETLPNGWVVERIRERDVELVYGHERQTLKIFTPRLPMAFP
jgi:general secretion pathway protein N